MSLREVYNRDIGILGMIIDMQQRGMPADAEYFRALSVEFQSEMDNIAELVGTVAGVGYINLASPTQVADLLYGKLKLNKLIPRFTGFSTDEDALNKIKHAHVAVPLVIRYRELGKLKGTYADGLIEKLGGTTDGRIHTSIRTTRTATGRLSSANPNLQNAPIRSEDGRRIRMGFRFPEGSGRIFISGDYEQIELKTLAHVSRDAAMMEIYGRGEDIHAATAAEMFQIPIDKVDNMKHRYPAKRVNFGIPYGITGKGLYDQFINESITAFSVADCDQFIQAWFKKYPGAKKWIDATRRFARQNGYVEDLFGRRTLVPEVYSSQPRIVEEGLRQAQNAPIQGAAAGVIKEAMRQLIPVYRKFIADGVPCYPLLQIHDDLLFETAEWAIPIILPRIKEIMEHAVELSIPISVDFKWGAIWGEMRKVK